MSCDPEGVHVGHVSHNSSLNDHISVYNHDEDSKYDWINKSSKNRSYNYLKSKFDNLPADKYLLVAGDLNKDMIFLDTIVDSHQVPQVSKYLQKNFIIESKPKVTSEDSYKWIMRISTIIGIIFTIIMIVKIRHLFEYVKRKNDYLNAKRDLILFIKYKIKELKKGEAIDLDSFKSLMRKKFSVSEEAINEVIEEVNREL